MGLFWGGRKGGEQRLCPARRRHRVPPCGDGDRAQGPALCRAPVLPAPVPTGQGGSPPAWLLAGNNSGFVRLRGLARRCGKRHPGRAGFPRDSGCVPERRGRAGTPRRAPPAPPAQVSPCGAGRSSASSLKHVAGAKRGVPCRVPRPGQAAGRPGPGGLQAGRRDTALPPQQAGRERLSRDWGNPSPDPPRSRKI